MTSLKREELTRSEILDRNLDLEDLTVLDSFSLSKTNFRTAIFKALLFTAVAIFIFFVPVNINGKTDIVFGVIYNSLQEFTGNVGLWFITIITILTALTSIYGKWIAKEGRLYNFYRGDSVIHPVLYVIGAIFATLYTLDHTTSFVGPEVVVGSSTGGVVIPGVAVAVFWIIFVSSFFMPFLTNYGFIDFIGALMEPLMRPLFKLPGRAAVNALVSFLSSSSVGVLITSKLYRRGVYTEKEAVLVATGFSAVSVGFAYMVINTAGLEDHFAFVYLSSSLMALLISAVMARIPPFNRKRDIYPNGHVQTEADLKAGRSPDKGIVKTGIDRAAKKAYTAPSLVSEIKSSLMDSVHVIPKVLTTIAVIGTGALIIAETTPVFDYLGKLFLPLLHLLRVPDAQMIAASFPLGIAEMFLPVLLIAENVDKIHIGARFLVTSVSIAQIIFFAETVVVMMSAGLPIKLWELAVAFFERTILGIIFGAIIMHIFFM